MSHVLILSLQHNASQPTNVPWQQRQNNSKGDVNDHQVVPSQSSTPRASTKASNEYFSVVDQIRKTNLNIYMWDIVATPSQKRLL